MVTFDVFFPRRIPLPILGTGWVNSFMLVWELTTCKAAEETSFRVVEAKCITCLDNSRGGCTPVPLQKSLNSLQ